MKIYLCKPNDWSSTPITSRSYCQSVRRVVKRGQKSIIYYNIHSYGTHQVNQIITVVIYNMIHICIYSPLMASTECSFLLIFFFLELCFPFDFPHSFQSTYVVCITYPSLHPSKPKVLPAHLLSFRRKMVSYQAINQQTIIYKKSPHSK